MLRTGGDFPTLSEVSRAALVQLLIHGPASRADLARQLQLSAPTLTRTVGSLEDAGLLFESSASPRTRTGRPARMMDVDGDRVHLIGVKVSQGQLNLARTDLRANVLSERIIEVSSTDPILLINALGDAINAEVAADPLIRAIGISLAGPVSPRSEIVGLSPFLGWEKIPLVAMIRERTGLPVVVENDVRALTAAEHWFGAAAGATDFALVTIGIGVGCGLVVDDRLIDGTNGGCGQIGHLRVTDSGPLCERGHRGCVRSYLSSTFMLRHAREAMNRDELGWEELLELAAAGQPVAARVVADAGHALGTVIGTVAALTAPSKILISGESVGLIPLVTDGMHEQADRIQHWTVPAVPIEVVPFTFTEWARGAAVIALQYLLRSAVRRMD